MNASILTAILSKGDSADLGIMHLVSSTGSKASAHGPSYSPNTRSEEIRATSLFQPCVSRWRNHSRRFDEHTIVPRYYFCCEQAAFRLRFVGPDTSAGP